MIVLHTVDKHGGRDDYFTHLKHTHLKHTQTKY